MLERGHRTVRLVRARGGPWRRAPRRRPRGTRARTRRSGARTPRWPAREARRARSESDRSWPGRGASMRAGARVGVEHVAADALGLFRLVEIPVVRAFAMAASRLARVRRFKRRSFLLPRALLASPPASPGRTRQRIAEHRQLGLLLLRPSGHLLHQPSARDRRSRRPRAPSAG
jgi:hypothetical protein